MYVNAQTDSFGCSRLSTIQTTASLKSRRRKMQNLTRPRVLCVDDDEDSREMLATLLRLALIEAKTIGTAAQVVDANRAWLPKIDGFEIVPPDAGHSRHTPVLFF